MRSQLRLPPAPKFRTAPAPDPHHASPFRLPRSTPRSRRTSRFAGETLCLFAYLLLKSRLNPYRTLSSRKQSLIANAKRSANSLSDVSLRAGDDYDSAGPVDLAPPIVHLAGWRRACLFWLPSFCDILGQSFVPLPLKHSLTRCVTCRDHLHERMANISPALEIATYHLFTRSVSSSSPYQSTKCSEVPSSSGLDPSPSSSSNDD